jgi:DNA-3-methyladenine glycosylase I
MTPRCPWCEGHDDYVAYHDGEWGRAETDDHRLFDKLCLEVFQCGLSWLTVLRKRERLRSVFSDFDPHALVGFTAGEIESALRDPGIIRHRGKIDAVVGNAQALLDMWARDETLADLVWSVAPTAIGAPRDLGEVPASTPESQWLAQQLRSRGFRFLGPTTVYAFMQAMGVVNDHLEPCHVRLVCEAERQAVLSARVR